MNGFFENMDGSTPLDPDEMLGLKLTHITTHGELNRFEQDNINEAIGWLESRRKKGEVFYSYPAPCPLTHAPSFYG